MTRTLSSYVGPINTDDCFSENDALAKVLSMSLQYCHDNWQMGFLDTEEYLKRVREVILNAHIV